MTMPGLHEAREKAMALFDLNCPTPLHGQRSTYELGVNTALAEAALAATQTSEPAIGKSMVEWCKEERAVGNGGCGACALCCKEWRERAELAEAKLSAPREGSDEAQCECLCHYGAAQIECLHCVGKAKNDLQLAISREGSRDATSEALKGARTSAGRGTTEMPLKTDKSIAEQRLEWAIAQLRHLHATSSGSDGAINRVIAALEEGQTGLLDENARLTAALARGVKEAREMVLRHAIRLAVELCERDKPVYRCQECQLSWEGARENHPQGEGCPVESALLALQTDPTE